MKRENTMNNRHPDWLTLLRIETDYTTFTGEFKKYDI